MVIELPREFEQFVAHQVETGKYAAPVDVVEDALRLLEQRDRQQLQSLREQVLVGIEQADRGELLDGEQVFDELERQLEVS